MCNEHDAVVILPQVTQTGVEYGERLLILNDKDIMRHKVQEMVYSLYLR